jgi:hypothetical protein
MTASALAAKLNLKPGMKVRLVGKPAGVDLPGVAGTASAKAEAIIVFVKTLDEVQSRAGPAVERGQGGSHRVARVSQGGEA